MVLAHPDHPLPVAVYDPVCIAVPTLSNRARPVAIPTAETLIGEVREIYRAVYDEKGSAAILMDPSPGVEGRRHNVGRTTPGGPTHDDIPAAFGRTHLDPVDILTVDGRLLEPDRPG